MSDKPLGRGRKVHIQHRSDRILAALYTADHPLTTQEIARKLGVLYGVVYQDLRRLSGSFTLPYAAAQAGTVNADGYPVVWHNWYAEGAYVVWSLTPEYRAAMDAEIRALEEAFGHTADGGGRS